MVDMGFTAEPERRRENREGNGGWTDGAKHEERARSYKGVVINGNTGQQNRGRDSKEYYGKGKGKMGEAPDSKWVKVPERGNRRPYNHYGNYRGNGEGSRVKTTYREAVPVVGSGSSKHGIFLVGARKYKELAGSRCNQERRKSFTISAVRSHLWIIRSYGS
ncbi:hypothetical protein F2Q70_00011246 [Brassica cretica]|uniref:Uncharacterized protein n=1 Tax=Brassica cretica TaxID=69181 RepID=A0A8S9LZG6_BRACR|nr:hypothetical protein F2Q70_00011246 [Brassica cretica]